MLEQIVPPLHAAPPQQTGQVAQVALAVAVIALLPRGEYELPRSAAVVVTGGDQVVQRHGLARTPRLVITTPLHEERRWRLETKPPAWCSTGRWSGRESPPDRREGISRDRRPAAKRSGCAE